MSRAEIVAAALGWIGIVGGGAHAFCVIRRWRKARKYSADFVINGDAETTRAVLVDTMKRIDRDRKP